MFGDFPYVLCIRGADGKSVYRSAYLEGEREQHWEQLWHVKDFIAMRREADAFGGIISDTEARRIFTKYDGFRMYVVPAEGKADLDKGTD